MTYKILEMNEGTPFQLKRRRYFLKACIDNYAVP